MNPRCVLAAIAAPLRFNNLQNAKSNKKIPIAQLISLPKTLCLAFPGSAAAKNLKTQ